MEVLLSEWLPDCLCSIITSYLEFYGTCIRSKKFLTHIWNLQPTSNGQFLCETFSLHLSLWDPETETSTPLTNTRNGSTAFQTHCIWIEKDKTLKRFDILTRTFNMEIVMEEEIQNFLILDDTHLMISVPNAWILLDTCTLSKLQTQMKPEGDVIALYDMHVAHTPDSPTIEIWNLVTGQMVRELKGHSTQISMMQYLANQRMATGGYDNSIKIWNLTTGICEMTLQQDVPVVEALISDHRLFTRSQDCMIRVWDMRTQRCEILSGPGMGFFLHDGYLVTYSKNNITFWV